MLRDDNSSHPGKIDVSLFAGIDTMHISSECVCVCVSLLVVFCGGAGE